MEESRYSRQEIFFGKELQKKIEGSTIGIVGLGALGSNAAEALARMGFGRLIIIDRDIVEEHNLHRTALYEEDDVGLPKDFSARKRLLSINPKTRVESHSLDIINSGLEILESCDIILDCLDNMGARRKLNEYCILNGKDWIYSSAIKNYGEAKIFFHDEECYECLYRGKETDERCTTHGVNPAIIRAVSSVQVNLLIKYLNENKEKRLFRINYDTLGIMGINFGKLNDCVCTTKKFSEIFPEQQCGNDVWQFSFDNEKYDALLAKNKSKADIINDRFFRVENAIIFNNGRIIIHDSEENAKKAFGSFFS